MSNVPVLESVRAAFEFRRLHWREAGGALAFVAAAATVDSGGQIAGELGLAKVGQIAGFFAFWMAYGALMRVAFADENKGDPAFKPGPQGFQWALPELRLIGAFVVLLFTCVVAIAVFAFAGVMFVAVTGLFAKVDPNATPQTILAALTPGQRASLYGIVGVSLLAGLYALLRLCLAPAATVARGRINVFSAWKLTQGQALRILAAIVLVNLPSILVVIGMGMVLQLIGQPVAGNPIPHAPLPLALALAALPGIISGFIQLPLSVGLAAYLYRGLRPAGEK